MSHSVALLNRRGGRSLLGIQAQIAKSQKDSKRLKRGEVDLATLRERQRYRGSLAALLNLPNPGVDKRSTRDEEGRAKVFRASFFSL